MGMFDYVEVPPVDCPQCGVPLEGWQTKAADRALCTVKFWEVSHFYTICVNCDVWVDFTLKPGLTLDNYEMTWGKRNG